MAESVYKIIELVGTSTDSWEKAAKAAVERAAKTLRDLRVAEIAQLDMTTEKGKVGPLPGEGKGVVQVRRIRHSGLGRAPRLTPHRGKPGCCARAWPQGLARTRTSHLRTHAE